MAPENSASIAAGPALKSGLELDVGAERLGEEPFSTPTRAVAWVMFGK